MPSEGIPHSDLTAIIRKAMMTCAKKGERHACDSCPLRMYCPATR